jgi:putative ABC transport system permease protein
MVTSVDGYEPKGDEASNVLLAPDRIVAGPSYFRTLGIPIIAGREFTDRDNANTPKVAVVNAKFAKYYFGDGNPIGRRVGWNGKVDTEIVGVVGDVRQYRLRDDSLKMWYVPYAQADMARWAQMTLHVRTAGPEALVASQIRSEIRAINSSVPIFDIRTIQDRVNDNLFRERILAMLSGFFAALACVLAAVGLYGVIAYTASLRTRELGIRIALGAARKDVVWMVMWDSLVVIGCGLLIGSALAYAVGGIAASFMYGVTARDPFSLIAAVLVVIAVSMLAAYVPARRASRLEPVAALHCE